MFLWLAPILDLVLIFRGQYKARSIGERRVKYLNKILLFRVKLVWI